MNLLGVFLSTLGARRESRRIADAAAFATFAGREALYLAQKTTIEYCRARSGFNYEKLFKEAMFNEAFDIARAEAFAACLSDVLLVAEARLRKAVPAGREAVFEASLRRSYVTALATVAPPAGDAARWEAATAEFATRLARVRLAPPRRPDEIARYGGRRLFEALPFDRSVVAHDGEMVVNALRFAMVRFDGLAADEIDVAALVADLCGDRSDTPS
jgi:hypothetical protein